MRPRLHVTESSCWKVAGVSCLVTLVFNEFPLLWNWALVPWLVAGAAALYGLALRDRSLPPLVAPEPAREPFSRFEGALLAALMILAALVRLWKVGELPFGLMFDESGVGMSAVRFLQPSPPGLFRTAEWWYVPNLQLFYVSIWMRLFDDSFVAVRLANGALGVVSVAGGYALVRHFFGRNVALITLALTIPFHWNVHYSRSGLSLINAAAIAVWALYAFVRGIARGSRLALGVCGFLMGTGMMCYWSNRATPLIVVAWWLLWLAKARPARRTAGAVLSIPAALALLAFSPMAQHYVENPSIVVPREKHNFIFAPENRALMQEASGSDSVPGILLHQIKRTFGVYCCTASRASWYEVDRNHVFGVLVPFFVIGILFSLVLLGNPAWRYLWSWFLITEFLGNVLHIRTPMSYHTLPLSPVVLVFAAFPMEWLRARLARFVGPWVPAALVAGVALFWAGENARAYEGAYGGRRNILLSESILDVLRSYPDVQRVSLVFSDDKFRFDDGGFRYIVPDSKKELLGDLTADEWPHALADGLLPALVIVPENAPVDVWLQARYPGAVRRKLRGLKDRSFMAMKIP